MWGGSSCRAMEAIGLWRMPCRARPSGSRTGMPSAGSHTPLSKPVAPRRRPSRKASRVFAGAWALPPRWAKAIGGCSIDGSRATARNLRVRAYVDRRVVLGEALTFDCAVIFDGGADGDLGGLDLVPAGDGEREPAADAEATLAPDLAA